MLMLNKFILKSAPLDLRLPVSSLFVVCLIVPYRNPATPNETLVLMLFMINTQNPGFNPNLISDVVVLVFSMTRRSLLQSGSNRLKRLIPFR